MGKEKHVIVTLPSETSAAADFPKEESSIFLRFRSGSESLKPDSSSTKVISFFKEERLFKIDSDFLKLTLASPFLQRLMCGSPL